MATKRLTDTISLTSSVALREYGTEKWPKVLIFLVDFPELLKTKLNTFLAFPRPNVYY